MGFGFERTFQRCLGGRKRVEEGGEASQEGQKGGGRGSTVSTTSGVSAGRWKRGKGVDRRERGGERGRKLNTRRTDWQSTFANLPPSPNATLLICVQLILPSPASSAPLNLASSSGVQSILGAAGRGGEGELK